MIVVESFGITDIGRKRKENEDQLLINDDLKLYLVADGMGGHAAGKVASNMTTEIIQEHITYNNQAETIQSENNNENLSNNANHLIQSIQLANSKIYKTAQESESYRGMGSTVSAVYFTNKTMIAANVGDSPIYLVHNNNIDLLSVPHTVLEERKALNIDENNFPKDKYSNMLTRAVGIDNTTTPDISEIQCFKGDILIIASDGLSNKVKMEEIHYIVNTEQPDDACKILVGLANKRGGEDNITIIVLKILNIYKETIYRKYIQTPIEYVLQFLNKTK